MDLGNYATWVVFFPGVRLKVSPTVCIRGYRSWYSGYREIISINFSELDGVAPPRCCCYHLGGFMRNCGSCCKVRVSRFQVCSPVIGCSVYWLYASLVAVVPGYEGNFWGPLLVSFSKQKES